MSKSTLAINAIINKENMSEVPSYLEQVMPIFGKNGGKPVGRFKTVNKLIGDESPEMVALIEFPDAEVIEQMIEGDDFQALSDLRGRVFKKINMFICEEM
jgi:uncharacterized protein (DUF1330 family)